MVWNSIGEKTLQWIYTLTVASIMTLGNGRLTLMGADFSYEADLWRQIAYFFSTKI